MQSKIVLPAGIACPAELSCGIRAVIMLESVHRLLLKRNCGGNNKRLDMISEEKSLLKKFGSGRTKKEIEYMNSSKFLVSVPIGVELLLLWTRKCVEL